ncbi:MAG: ATP-binding cassette domain-containing protein [Burkholderiales bacterium]|nr:ATP-binding cassette domain-containing protein [Burkholderiales bacterium]
MSTSDLRGAAPSRPSSPTSSPAPSAAPVLRVSGLSVAYGGNTALSVDALEVREGEVLGVVGANGAGKSTLVNAIAGWSRGAPRVAGRVFLDGADLSALPAHDRARAGLLLVPEGKLVFGQMTVDENLSVLAEVAADKGRRVYDREAVFELFPRLRERRGHLGLDEPSIGLAPRLVATVLQTMRTLASTGLTILLVEQNVRAAIDIVDRLVLLERGRVVVEGSAAAMRDDPRIAQAYLGTKEP